MQMFGRKKIHIIEHLSKKEKKNTIYAYGKNDKIGVSLKEGVFIRGNGFDGLSTTLNSFEAWNL